MIKLTKDKIIYSNHFNPEWHEYVEKEVEHLYLHLNERVVLSSDFTLEDFFNHIERDKETFDLIFSSCLGHYSLQLWIDEIKKPGPKEDDEIDYLEIHRWGEYWDWGDIDLSISISGVGKKEDGPSYGIGFTSLNELKHLSLRLNEDFGISEGVVPSKIVLFFARLLKKIGVPVGKWDNPFEHTYVKGKVVFTVYELIATVLYEISWYGDPEGRDSEMDKLNKMVDDIKSGDLSNFTKWEG